MTFIFDKRGNTEEILLERIYLNCHPLELHPQTEI